MPSFWQERSSGVVDSGESKKGSENAIRGWNPREREKLTVMVLASVIGGVQRADGRSDPAVDGAWSPAYRLVEITDEPGTLKEIAHAVVLPEAAGRVLFWTQVTINSTQPLGVTHTWLWDPNSPQNVTKIDVPNAIDGSQELFCGGHSWLPNGNLLAFGGTDATQSSLTGHASVFHFTISDLQWHVLLPPFPQPLLALSRARWYPYGFVLPAQPSIGNRMLVLGHTALPAGSADYLDIAPVPALTDFVEQSSRAVGATSDCDTNALVEGVGDYPRATVLARTQRLFYRESANQVRNGFLRLDQNCSQDAMRWDFVTTTLNGQPPKDHNEGQMAHYVTYDSAGQAVDTIYVMGGINRTTGPSQFVTIADAEKITNPITANTVWTDIPNLTFARAFANCTILADGSMMIVGGDAEPDHDPPFAPVMAPERYRPPEVFTIGSSGWERLADQVDGRCYHSVSGTLPDGRVFSAGGAVPGSWHSAEIYSPPYLFQGARPVISGVATNWTYGSSQGSGIFTVTTRQGVTAERFHLLRNGSITHGYDANQRFVMLWKMQGSDSLPAGQFQLDAPPSEQVAPPGYYFLYVVDSNGVPSVGHRIHLAPWSQERRIPCASLD
jgi:Domain of unknown function (DUF1929)